MRRYERRETNVEVFECDGCGVTKPPDGYVAFSSATRPASWGAAYGLNFSVDLCPDCVEAVRGSVRKLRAGGA